MPLSGHRSPSKPHPEPCPLGPPDLRALSLDMPNIVYRLCSMQLGQKNLFGFSPMPFRLDFISHYCPRYRYRLVQAERGSELALTDL
jgi:hypothetical protein